MRSFLYFALAATVWAAPHNIVHETRGDDGFEGFWKRSAVDDKTAIIPVRIALTQSNLEDGYDHLMRVSHPSSKHYGKYWSKDEVEEEFAPSDFSIGRVMDWLSAAGIREAQPTSNRGWIAFDAPAGQVEELLGTQFHEYKHAVEGSTRLGCDEYSLPEDIAPHIDYITPGVRLSAPVEKRTVGLTKRAPVNSTYPVPGRFKPAKVPAFKGNWIVPPKALNLPKNVQNCGLNITPPCLQYMYGIPKPTAQTHIANNSIGVFELDAAYAQGDLNSFFHKNAPYVPKGTHPENIDIFGVPAPAETIKASSEADLDFMVVYALVGNNPVTFYNTGLPNNYKGVDNNLLLPPLLDAVEGSFCTASEKKGGFICGGYNLSQVVSVSYGLPELFFAPAQAQRRICHEMMKLSLQGHTFVIASGDYGVAANPGVSQNEFGDNGCIPSDLQKTFDGTIFNVNFPASCPYVLSVGATMLTPEQTVKDPESAMNVAGVGLAFFNPTVTFSSTGGFSNYFPQPKYQKSAVTTYLNNHKPKYKTYTATGKDVSTGNSSGIGANGGVYNIAGRAIPDVSANGVNFTAFTQGEYGSLDGTSVAAPIWASVITLLNTARAAMGKSPVGFINPALYQNAGAMHDIVNGSNPGCGTNGFPAVPGWDPVTGLGTPNYPSLLKVFQDLP